MVTLAAISIAVLVICLTMPRLIDAMMYGVIVGLGILTLVSSFIVARHIDRQSTLAAEQVRVLEEVDNFDTFFKRTADQPSDFRRHIANLYDIACAHTDVSQDRLIQILQSRLRARNKVNDLFASILTTLGLIGTIVGLVVMMGSLSSQVKSNAGNTQQLMTALFDQNGGALAGLGVAFITTLLGAVLGGVILRVLTSVVDTSITNFTALVAELTEVHVLPSLRTLAEKRAEERRLANASPAVGGSRGN
jgi:flagellar motor component MotA